MCPGEEKNFYFKSNAFLLCFWSCQSTRAPALWSNRIYNIEDQSLVIITIYTQFVSSIPSSREDFWINTSTLFTSKLLPMGLGSEN